jgi:hypothetical protein
MPPYRTIIIGARTHYAVKVSPQDYDYLMQWRWTFAVSHKGGGLIYARRSIRSGGSNVTILMHRVVIEECMKIPRPSDRHFVDHENGDSLDNRRFNDDELQQLRWLTAAEQMQNQRGIIQRPLTAAAIGELLAAQDPGAGIPF